MRPLSLDGRPAAPHCPDCNADGVLTLDGDVVCGSCGRDLVHPVIEASRRERSTRLAPPAA